jgi:hypothetical protein
MNTVNDVVKRVGAILVDPEALRWTVEERTLWVNDGLRELLVRKPAAYTRHVMLALKEGEVQALPGDCRTLVEVRQSYLPSEALYAAVPRVGRALLSATRPAWAGKAGRGEVRNWCWEESDPDRFYVYPPQPEDDQGTVELIYYARPPWLQGDDPLPVGDEYTAVLVNYVLFRAYSKDAEFAANAQIAAQYFQVFTSALP